MPSPYGLARAIWQRTPEPIRRAVDAFAPTRWIRRRFLRSAITSARHDEIYDERYYESTERTSRASAPIIADSIVSDLAPATVLDVGCGTGAILDALRSRGVAVRGLEYAEAGLAICRGRGLEVSRFDLESDDALDVGCADVVISTEVAEHLPASCADRYADLLCRAGDTIVFTAATPGQGGWDHVNEQPHEYWLERFAARGFELDDGLTRLWRRQWEEAGTAAWYARNVCVLRRRVPTA